MGERDLRRPGDSRAKSNVYSIGIIMMFMTCLELPMFVTALKDLQLNIEKRLKDVEYSQKWIKAVRRLLTVDELERPDFLQLLDEINRPLIPFLSASITSESFLDDEPLDPTATAFATPVDPLKVTIACGVSYVRVNPFDIDGEIPCVLQLEAQHQEIKRPGLDVVCIIDVGKGETELKVVKAGLYSVVQRLSDRDRMAIIAYGQTGRKLAKLTVCSKIGKSTLNDVILRIRPEVGTNFTAGLVSALHALTQCRSPNSLTSIFVFGNGAGAGYDQTIATCVEMLRTFNVDQRLSLHFFAPGQEPNFQLLLAMQREACGGLYLVPSEETVKTAVESALNLLDSVVARGLTIAASEDQTPYCSVGNYMCLGATVPLKLPYIVSGQRFELVFLLSATEKATISGSMKRPTIRFNIQYKGNQEEDISLSQELDVWLLPQADSPNPSKNSAVYTSFYRRKTALCLFGVLSLVCEGQRQEAWDSVRECMRDVQGEEVQKDLNCVEQAVSKERLTEEDWVQISNLATKYYYYQGKEGKEEEEQLNPALKRAEQLSDPISPLKEILIFPKQESPVPPQAVILSRELESPSLHVAKPLPKPSSPTLMPLPIKHKRPSDSQKRISKADAKPKRRKISR